MKKLYQDRRINKENIYEFNTRGWTLVDLNLSKRTIEEATLGLKKMRFDAIKNDYKARRIYFDHLLTNNLAAIELPFNKNICNKNIRSLFMEAKIGSLVKTLMGWEKPCCDLARLFCMGDFKYRTMWHRDYDADLRKIHLNSNSRFDSPLIKLIPSDSSIIFLLFIKVSIQLLVFMANHGDEIL